MNRRGFLKTSAGLLAADYLLPHAAHALAEPTSLDPWKPGYLEIHHIATNRGNSALLILPDGTTMMIDAGAFYETTPYLSPTRPSDEHRPGEWLGRYAQRRGLKSIDTFLATHLHPDHLGAMPPNSKAATEGFARTGVSDVDAIVPIHRFVDRAWPDYTYPLPANADFQQNYRAFLKAKQSAGATVERFRVGTKDQFRLQHDSSAYANFEIRNLVASGEMWTGQGEETVQRFPALSMLKPADYPSENACSAAIRLRYGRFSYYTGGDLPFDSAYGRDPWRDIETPVAKVCGPISVAVANHHGYFNACGPEYFRALRPTIFVIPSWDSAHPTVNTLDAFFSEAIYPGPRYGFATLVKEENRIANKKTDRLLSRNGHIVIRVDPGGTTYRVHILSNEDETDRITATFGPYQA
ncbi:MAG TPA: MBL fold metallo-hydrolase [Acidobacteriaceae bacterium]|jgi:hypothetical protein